MTHALIALAFHAAVAGSGFSEDFAAPGAPLWQLSAGGAGKAALEDGRLVLDMSRPAAGKWAFADLSRAIALPARIEWDQCLAHDSPHTYFGGVRVLAGQMKLTAGIGGGGLGRCAFLSRTRSAEGRIKPGQWYRLVLEIQPVRQSLTVFTRGRSEPLLGLDTWTAFGRGPVSVRFFQCDPRLGPAFPDAYDQDRGATWIDNVRITAAGIKPRKQPKRPPATTNPFSVPLVFSRAMRWVTKAEGLSRGCIAYDAAGWLPLTGDRPASRWLELRPWPNHSPTHWPDQPNVARQAGGSTLFGLPEGTQESTFVLRAFQFNLEQHGTLAWRGDPQGVEWRLEATATDGMRQFLWTLWRSPWSCSQAEGTLDLRSVYRDAGRPNRYAEVDVLLRLRRTPGARAKGQFGLRLGLEGRAAVVPRWPVVATVQQARDHGVLLEAIAVDQKGGVIRGASASLEATVAGQTVRLDPVGDHGVRRGVARGLGPGEHVVRVVARDRTGREIASTAMTVDVTPLAFLTHYDPDARSYCTASGRAVGPLLGDLFAWVPYSELSAERRRLILGMPRKPEGQPFSYTKWRSLPRADIDAYIGYMADSGVRVLRLTPNVNPNEYYLDAGGVLAPHGMEQFAYILAAGRRRGMRAVVNLTHYPYLRRSTGNKPPVQRYIEAGYPGVHSWTSAEMWRLLSGYLDQLLGFTGEDPAVKAYTVMGENDQMMPADWLNRAYGFIKSRAPRQMVVLEQGGGIRQDAEGRLATWREFRPATDGGVGYRAYRTERCHTDCFMAVAARLFNTARPSFLGEVSCGIHTEPGFVTKYRDAMGLALTLQQGMGIAWSAVMVEGQCKAFTEAARQVDWTSFRRADPPVAIVVDKAGPEQIRRLVQVEAALSAVPVDYRYVRDPVDQAGAALVLDGRLAAADEPVSLDLPADVVSRSPLRLSPGNHCSYALSQDRGWLVAYVRNAGHYEIGLCDIRSVGLHRLADRPRPVTIELRGFPGKRRFRIWDAATADVLRDGAFAGHVRLELGPIAADLVLLVRPAEQEHQ